jgi:hypothetical protein
MRAMGALPDYLEQAWPTERQLERFKLVQPLKVFVIGVEVGQGTCFDVSIGGLGASVAAPLQLGQEVSLDFPVPTREARLHLKAVVRHFEAGRAGFEFLTITPQDRDSILSYGSSLTEKKRPKLIRR